jgi:hypothetical protein
MTPDTEPVVDFHRVEVIAVAIIRIAWVSGRSMTCRASLKLVCQCDVFDRVMAAGARDVLRGLMREARVRVDYRFMFPVIEQHQTPHA